MTIFLHIILVVSYFCKTLAEEYPSPHVVVVGPTGSGKFYTNIELSLMYTYKYENEYLYER